MQSARTTASESKQDENDFAVITCGAPRDDGSELHLLVDVHNLSSFQRFVDIDRLDAARLVVRSTPDFMCWDGRLTGANRVVHSWHTLQALPNSTLS